MTAVVTGASGGIGGAIAVALAERGAVVCLGGRDHERLEAAAERVTATGHGRAELFRADLTVEAELAELAAALRSRRVDILSTAPASSPVARWSRRRSRCSTAWSR